MKDPGAVRATMWVTGTSFCEETNSPGKELSTIYYQVGIKWFSFFKAGKYVVFTVKPGRINKTDKRQNKM